MAHQVIELEQILQQLTSEHRKLLTHVEKQQEAMKAMDLQAMDHAANQQEAARLRIAVLEARRRVAVQQLGRMLKLPEPVTLQNLASLLPAAQRESLMRLRA